MEGGSTNFETTYHTGLIEQPYDHRQIILGVFVLISACLPILAPPLV
jgi:hypothetical protein